MSWLNTPGELHLEIPVAGEAKFCKFVGDAVRANQTSNDVSGPNNFDPRCIFTVISEPGYPLPSTSE